MKDIGEINYIIYVVVFVCLLLTFFSFFVVVGVCVCVCVCVCVYVCLCVCVVFFPAQVSDIILKGKKKEKRKDVLLNDALNTFFLVLTVIWILTYGRKCFTLTVYGTCFINGYMASDIQRVSL